MATLALVSSTFSLAFFASQAASASLPSVAVSTLAIAWRAATLPFAVRKADASAFSRSRLALNQSSAAASDRRRSEYRASDAKLLLFA